MLRNGDLTGAEAAYDESLRYKLEVGGDVDGLLKNIGNLHRQRGDFKTARTYLIRALKGLLERGSHLLIPNVLEGLGLLAVDQHHSSQAAILLGAASRQREAMNAPKPPVEREELERAVLTIRETLGEDGFAVTWAEGHAMTLEQAVRCATQPVDMRSEPVR